MLAELADGRQREARCAFAAKKCNQSPQGISPFSPTCKPSPQRIRPLAQPRVPGVALEFFDRYGVEVGAAAAVGGQDEAVGASFQRNRPTDVGLP